LSWLTCGIWWLFPHVLTLFFAPPPWSHSWVIYCFNLCKLSLVSQKFSTPTRISSAESIIHARWIKSSTRSLASSLHPHHPCPFGIWSRGFKTICSHTGSLFIAGYT
jgi:hypothetical protein